MLARIRSLLRGMRNKNLDADMQAEFAFHIEARAADLVKQGMSPTTAARQARVEFGGTYNYKEAGREARGLRWFDFLRISWLDVKLGGRMIRRYPGLTVVSGVAMGVAIALGASIMGAFSLLRDPHIPLDEGDRIVGITLWNMRSDNAERRIASDLANWKTLNTVKEVTVFRNALRAVGSDAAATQAEPVRGVEMSASGFRVARVRPQLGRYLLDDDDRPGAPRVVVLSDELWRSRFVSDPNILGRVIKVGGIDHTVIGVMPPGYAFPVNYSMWLPLSVDPGAYTGRDGPALYALGRLATGATLEEANAEIATVNARQADEHPKAYQNLQARVVEFTRSWFELDGPDMQLAYRSAQIAVSLLLMIICVNVSILVYARTATRQAEIAVRSALGASRSRIVAQLVGESLALAGVGALVAYGLVTLLVSRMGLILEQTGAAAKIPFWMTLTVAPSTVGWLAALALAGALIIGVVPALQVTGKQSQQNLQRLSGGKGSVRMGKLWTSMIVAEVALTVGILPSAVFMVQKSIDAMTAGPGFAASEYLAAELTTDRETFAAIGGNGPAYRPVDAGLLSTRFAPFREEVMRRISAEPDVAGVTFTAAPLGEEGSTQMEVEGFPVTKEEHDEGDYYYVRWHGALRARWANVGAEFFDVMDKRAIAGRTFVAADGLPGGSAVVVNRAFVDQILHGRNAVGLKLRSLDIDANGRGSGGPWKEIVGVVDNIPATVDYERSEAAFYEPVRALLPPTLLIRVRGGDPTSFSQRLRKITAEVHPALFLRKVEPLSDVLWESHLPLRLMTVALITITLAVLVLSAAGLYALMTVIVTQRLREIGIRVALGAGHAQVLSGIFSRAAVQVCGGIVIGLAIAAMVNIGIGDEMRTFNALLILPGVSAFMLGVGVLAALGPARRGLAVQPISVLKED